MNSSPSETLQQTFYRLGKQYLTLQNYISSKEYFLLALHYSEDKNIEIVTSLCEVLLHLNERSIAQSIILKTFNVQHLSFLTQPYPQLTTQQLLIITKCFENDADSFEILSSITPIPTEFVHFQPSDTMQIANNHFQLINKRSNKINIQPNNPVFLDPLNIGLIYILLRQEISIKDTIIILQDIISRCSINEIRTIYDLVLSLLTRNDVNFVQLIILMKQSNQLLESSQIVQFIEATHLFLKQKYEESFVCLEKCNYYQLDIFRTSLQFHLNQPIHLTVEDNSTLSIIDTIEMLNEYSSFNVNDENCEYTNKQIEIIRYKIALQLYQEKKIEKCIEILKSSKLRESQIFLGYIYSQQKLYTNAIEELSQVLLQIPYSFELKIVLIQQYILNGNHVKAENELNELAQQVSTWDIYMTLGELFYSQEKYDQSLQWYLKSIENIPNDNQRLIKIGFMNVAQCQRKLGNYNDAIQYFNKADFVNEFVCLSGLGYCYYKLENKEDALNCFQRALGIKDDPICRKYIQFLSLN